MIKIFNYFLQAFFVYSFFLIGRILHLKISRKLFSNLFYLLGPLFKSKKIVEKNLDIFSDKISIIKKKDIINNMWKNYGKT